MSKVSYSTAELQAMTPADFRLAVRQNQWPEMTPGMTGGCCRGYAQANLAIIPAEMAGEFLLFCQRNPSPCPVLDVTERGNPHPMLVAPEADLRTDVGKYRVFREGKLIDEPTDVVKYWRDDLVAFVIGCSLSFDWALKASNIPYRFIGEYTTNIQCIPAGRFHGPMRVTCRLFDGSHNAIRAIQISSRYPGVHGAPIAIGDPKALGIKDLCRDGFSGKQEPIAPQKASEVALFWGCGVTPQLAAMESKIPFMITHASGHMLITDKLAEDFAVI